MDETDCFITGDFDPLLKSLRKDQYKNLVLSASRRLNLYYSDFKDYEERISYNHSILLNTFGDSAGASYFRLRKEYDKKRIKLNMPPLKHDVEIKKVLNYCLKCRNYVHHFSEPKLVTWRNFREQQLESHPNIVWPPNDLIITRYNIVNIGLLLEFFNFHNSCYEMFNLLQYAIRNDYCILATGNACNESIRFNIIDDVDDNSAIIISEEGSSLYSE